MDPLTKLMFFFSTFHSNMSKGRTHGLGMGMGMGMGPNHHFKIWSII